MTQHQTNQLYIQAKADHMHGTVYEQQAEVQPDLQEGEDVLYQAAGNKSGEQEAVFAEG